MSSRQSLSDGCDASSNNTRTILVGSGPLSYDELETPPRAVSLNERSLKSLFQAEEPSVTEEEVAWVRESLELMGEATRRSL